jgi:hypothetical protein
VYYTRSLFWCNTKSKSVKKTAKQEKNKIFFDVFSSSLLKSGKNMGTENVDQRTNRRPKDRTDTSLISLSLSLSFVSCMHLFTVLLPGRKKDTESPVRRRRRESSLLRQVSLSLRSRDGVVVSSESERTKKASIRPRKKNKQTKDGETKNLKKCQRGIFQRARAAEILGDFWRRLFTKN